MANQEPLVANNTNTITMSMRELDRLKVVEAVVEGRLMPWRAAERLDVSRRQVERLVARYRASGPAGLVSQRRGQPSNHQLPEDLAHRALSVIRDRYADFATRAEAMRKERFKRCRHEVLNFR
ncbi:helix-turn-helix domain-containing protein [Burkholderia ubonensis]|uniref:helix-turn-helix domain-containing protein n=1 Tax=Burkholderia ubonensis TaxID=101571 RepID=UPI000AF6BF8C